MNLNDLLPSNDEVVRLVRRVQSGEASKEEKNTLATWIMRTVYDRLILAGHWPERAEEYAKATLARVWQAIVKGDFCLEDFCADC